MAQSYDSDGKKLPIKVDSTSNGEYEPVPIPERAEKANTYAQEFVGTAAKHTDKSRRSFLTSICGAAATLAAFNTVNTHFGATGGVYALDKEAPFDPAAALDALGKKEFIFDVQGHFVDPEGDWLKGMPESARPFAGMQGNACVVSRLSETEEGRDYLTCLNADSFIKDVFLDSDTDMMVLSFVPSHREAEPLTISEAAVTQKMVDALDGHARLLLHGRVNPNQPGDMEDMEVLARDYKVSAFKTYTQWGLDGNGFAMTDEDTGIAFIERARSLGVKNIAIHKGIPFSRGPSYKHSRCDDIGPIAARFPDVNFLIYHSGFDQGVEETAFEAGSGKAGVDTLIQSLMDNGIGKHSNVYAELGSTWRFLMRNPNQAAHTMGKLLKHLGEDNILWGTDSVWYGSPQDQILAFRAFQISEEFQERYGYPAISETARAKIFGLNGARVYGIDVPEVVKRAHSDIVSDIKHDYVQSPNPHFETFGPKNRRQFMALLKSEGVPS